MTTFTMQDLNNNGVATPEEEEALSAMAKLGAGVDVSVLLDGHVGVGKAEAIAKHEAMHAWTKISLDAPNPQTTLCESTQTQIDPIALIDEMMTQFSIKLKLLATVISQTKGNSQAEDQSLQACVATTLQQADWFKDMVREIVEDQDFGDEIETYVDRHCENYFSYNFDPRDHFDIDEAVADRVDDRLEDVVADKIQEVVEEKLSEASISISF